MNKQKHVQLPWTNFTITPRPSNSLCITERNTGKPLPLTPDSPSSTTCPTLTLGHLPECANDTLRKFCVNKEDLWGTVFYTGDPDMIMS
jgi:hypothetical protein